MSRCEAELCSNWTGDGCICAVVDGDPEAIDEFETWLDDVAAAVRGEGS